LVPQSQRLNTLLLSTSFTTKILEFTFYRVFYEQAMRWRNNIRKHAKRSAAGHTRKNVRGKACRHTQATQIGSLLQRTALLVTRCFYQTARKALVVLLLKNFSTLTRVSRVVYQIYFRNKNLVKLRLLMDELNNF